MLSDADPLVCDDDDVVWCLDNWYEERASPLNGVLPNDKAVRLERGHGDCLQSQDVETKQG